MINSKIIAFGIFSLELICTFTLGVPGGGGRSAFSTALIGILLICFPSFFGTWRLDGGMDNFTAKFFGWIFLLGYLIFLLYFYLKFR